MSTLFTFILVFIHIGRSYIIIIWYAINIFTSKIKFFKHPKGDLMVIGGIQTTYLHLGDNTEITSQESKGKNVDKNNVDEFPLQRNEYITSFTLWEEEGSINKISFKTNLKRSYSVGDQKGRELRITELDEDKKIILSFFGTYNDNYLSSIGFFLPKKMNFLIIL